MTRSWDDYVSGFHSRRPGITEDVLSGSVDPAGINPYEWLAAPVWARGPVGDLACGSGPMAPLLSRWAGFDRSLPELGRGAEPVARVWPPTQDGFRCPTTCSAQPSWPWP